MRTTLSRCALLATLVGLWLQVDTQQASAAMTYQFMFDNRGLGQPPPPLPPFIGSGTLTIANNPGTGTFALNSLGGFSLSFTVGTSTFTTADIRTPISEVLVVITATSAGQQVQFSNNSPTGSGTGPVGGSLDLMNAAGATLSFEPPAFGGTNLYQLIAPGGTGLLAAGNYRGLSGASVPEPSSFALCALAGAVGLTVARARRQPPVG